MADAPKCRVDDFLTAGHRFNEFGVCVEPLPGYWMAQTGDERCPVRWEDIEDITGECNASGTEVWVNQTGIAHSGVLFRIEITQIEARKAGIVWKVCMATGWRT